MFEKIKDRIRNIIGRNLNVILYPILFDHREQIYRGVQRLLTIQSLHQKTFAGFKNYHEGKDIVIVGAGPSVQKFKPLENCIYIGLNSACTFEKVKYDYLFTIDKIGIDKIYPQFAAIDCIKFVGDQNLGPAFQIPETEIAKMGNVLRYKTDAGLYSSSSFTHDIETEPLGNFNSVSLQAVQFALYTNPRRIYLVGIDCSNAGHFNEKQNSAKELSEKMKSRGENINNWAKDTTYLWTTLKGFANTYYPGVEIISVNPVGLRGLFKDIDQI